MAAPLAWVLLLSVKTLPDAYRNAIWPQRGFDLSHYGEAIARIDLLPINMANSLILTLSAVALTTACATFAGYALVHLRTPGKAVVLALMVGALFFPIRVTGLIGIWEITRTLGLLNTRIGLVPAYVTLGLALGVIIMRAVFQAIPAELMQAARVDGAGPWAAFRHVALPLVWNGVVVTGMITFILAWGEYLFAITLVTDRELQTLPVVLAGAIGGRGQWAWPLIAAVYVMAIIPALVLFALVQKRFMRGLEEGTLKG
jgi:ABC-type glycerol-3-phosphate transport system permease component